MSNMAYFQQLFACTLYCVAHISSIMKNRGYQYWSPIIFSGPIFSTIKLLRLCSWIIRLFKMGWNRFWKRIAILVWGFKVWVFWEGYKIWKKSLSYFWQERRVLCAQQRTCQKVDEDFSKQMWSSRIIQTLRKVFY